MYFGAKGSGAKCQHILTVTDDATYRCHKPATVASFVGDELIVLCSEHARKLVHELLESVPGGERDLTKEVARIEAKKRNAR